MRNFHHMRELYQDSKDVPGHAVAAHVVRYNWNGVCIVFCDGIGRLIMQVPIEPERFQVIPNNRVTAVEELLNSEVSLRIYGGPEGYFEAGA